MSRRSEAHECGECSHVTYVDVWTCDRCDVVVRQDDEEEWPPNWGTLVDVGGVNRDLCADCATAHDRFLESPETAPADAGIEEQPCGCCVFIVGSHYASLRCAEHGGGSDVVAMSHKEDEHGNESGNE